jgi:hypothetical protein
MAVCGDGTARPGVETTRGSFFEALRTDNAALRLDRHGTARPKEVIGQVAHDLTQLASDLVQTKADATNWLKGAVYATLRSKPR